MNIIKDMTAWQALRRELTGSIGFVPTMGALHDGHLSLVRASKKQNDLTVLSIYVNPTQFNDPKDLSDYPDTLSDDLAAAKELGVDFVIMPRYEDIYSDGYRFQVNESEFSDALCGANRPGHFTGVMTVVMKLLNLVRPDRAYFGQKDYQQYQLVKDMAETFFLDVEIIGCETVREQDGLAMSSRNKLLSPNGRAQAGYFNKALRMPKSDEAVAACLTARGFTVDYIETRDARRFGAVVVTCDDRQVRLIDNVPSSADRKSAAQSIASPATKEVEVA